jgi:hypothetical protein
MPQYLAQFDDGAGFRVFIQYLLQDELLVTATAAFSQCMRDITLFGPGPMSQTTSRYYAKAVTMLRSRLKQQRSHLTDSVILAIYQLLSVEAFASVDEASSNHIVALKTIIHLRGGLEQLGFWGLLQGFATVWITYRSLKDRLVAPGTATSDLMSTVPTYPELPLVPEVCARLAVCPQGCIEMVLSGCLCLEILQVLERLMLAVSGRRESSTLTFPKSTLAILDELVITCELLLKHKSLSQQEHLFLVGLLALCCYWRDVGSEVSRCFLHTYCAYLSGQNLRHFALLPQKREMVIRTDALQIWVGMVLYATTEPNTEALTLAQKLLKEETDVSATLALCKLFLWDEDLTIRFHTGPGKVAEPIWGQRF